MYSELDLPSEDEDDPYTLPPEEEEREDLTQDSDIDVIRRHSQAGDGDIVGPSRQTRLQARVAAVNFARITLNNIKVHPVSDAFLAQQNQDLDPSTVAQPMRRSDWPKWKDATDAELESFYTLKVCKYAKLPPMANLI